MNLIKVKRKVTITVLCSATQGGLNSMPGGLILSARVHKLMKCHVKSALIHIKPLGLPKLSIKECGATVCQNTDRSDVVFMSRSIGLSSKGTFSKLCEAPDNECLTVYGFFLTVSEMGAAEFSLHGMHGQMFLIRLAKLRILVQLSQDNRSTSPGQVLTNGY